MRRAAICLRCAREGLSGPLRGVPSVDRYALDAAAIAYAVGEPVHLFSMAGGCHAAARFAAEQPSRVLSLTLFNPSPFELLDTRLISILENDYDMGLLVGLRIAFDIGPEVSVQEVAAEYARGLSEEAVRRIGEPSVNTAVSLGKDLQRVQAPVLVIGPEDDVRWPGGRQTAALLPGATYWKTRVFPYNRALGRAVREGFESFLHSEAWRSGSQPVRQETNGLSPRELEVLGLIPHGDTNPEIADAFGLSTRTVERHIQNIYNKLGVHNRVEATNWAREHGLS